MRPGRCASRPLGPPADRCGPALVGGSQSTESFRRPFSRLRANSVDNSAVEHILTGPRGAPDANGPPQQGAVAQLVRVPDCRSGCCGFESRRPRSPQGLPPVGKPSLCAIRAILRASAPLLPAPSPSCHALPPTASSSHAEPSDLRHPVRLLAPPLANPSVPVPASAMAPASVIAVAGRLSAAEPRSPMTVWV